MKALRLLLAACLLQGCLTGRPLVRASSPPSPRPEQDARAASAVLRAFAQAILAGRFDQAYPLLAAPLRSRYTPETLRRDYELEPLARARLDRAVAALPSGPVAHGTELDYPLGPGRTLRLVREGRELRIASLE